ncbi:oleosin 16 kDa, partial [Phtheirospermum japonicum]
QKLREHAPNSTQLVGLATLVISGGHFAPPLRPDPHRRCPRPYFLRAADPRHQPDMAPDRGSDLHRRLRIFVLLAGSASPPWRPASWLYRYFRGFHPPGSDRFDYARTRIADTAEHVKGFFNVFMSLFPVRSNWMDL